MNLHESVPVVSRCNSGCGAPPTLVSKAGLGGGESESPCFWEPQPTHFWPGWALRRLNSILCLVTAMLGPRPLVWLESCRVTGTWWVGRPLFFCCVWLSVSGFLSLFVCLCFSF